MTFEISNPLDSIIPANFTNSTIHNSYYRIPGSCTRMPKALFYMVDYAAFYSISIIGLEILLANFCCKCNKPLFIVATIGAVSAGIAGAVHGVFKTCEYILESNS